MRHVFADVERWQDTGRRVAWTRRVAVAPTGSAGPGVAMAMKGAPPHDLAPRAERPGPQGAIGALSRDHRIDRPPITRRDISEPIHRAVS